MSTFGEYVKERRQAAGYSLREWCRTFGYDPSNWSKIERGRLLPPADLGEINRIAQRLGVGMGSRAWSELHDLAIIARGQIPADVLSDEEVLRCLPVFVRCCRGDRPTEEELDALISLLKRHG